VYGLVWVPLFLWAAEPSLSDMPVPESDPVVEAEVSDGAVKEPSTVSSEEAPATPETVPADTGSSLPTDSAAVSSETPPLSAEKPVSSPARHTPGPVRFTGYSSSRAEIRFDAKSEMGSKPDNYGDVVNETLIEGHYDAYTIGVRKNFVLFFLKNDDPLVEHYEYRYSPEAFNHGWEHYLDRFYAKGDWRLGSFDLTATVGDFYESMNRGLVFSMLREAGGEDNAVRGGSLAVKGYGFHIKAFGGIANPFLRDRASLERMGEARDTLWGTEFGYRIAEMLDLGVEYGGGLYDDYLLDRQRWDDPLSPRTYQNKYFHLVGLYADLFRLIPRTTGYLGATLVPAGTDRWVSEAVWGDTRKRTDLSLANALYFSLTNWHDISKSRLTLTLEGKRYERYWLNYRTMEDPDYVRCYFKPPTLNWDNLPLLNDLNTMALRTRVQFSDNDLTGLTAAVEFIGGLSEKYRDTWEYAKDRVPKEDHWLVGGSLERRFGPASLAAKAAFRRVNGSDDPYRGETLYTQLLGGFGWSGFSAKLNLELYRRDLAWLDTVEEKGAIEHGHVLDFSWKNILFISYVGTYYRNVFETTFYERDEEKYYPGGSVGYAYRSVRLSLFGGLMRGGLTCIGGVCRNLPDFKGVKMEVEVKL